MNTTFCISKFLPLSFLLILSIHGMVKGNKQLTSDRLGQAKSWLTVRINDETGRPTPVRVHLTFQDGRIAPLPQGAVSIMYGRRDRAEGYSYQPDSSFYADGQFRVELEPGKYNLSLSKGFEYLAQQHQITIEAKRNSKQNYKMERWINMPSQKWFSADDHIHIRRSPRENPLILKWVAAEDVHIGVLLQMGDIGNPYYYSQYSWGKKGVYYLENRMLASGQEDPRTHEIGHVISIGADDFVRFQNDYYRYDQVFDRIHELNGLTGYAHQGMSFNGHRGMTLDVLHEKVDFLELLQFCVEGGPLLTDHYYFFLDLGFKLTATAGSDFPWCGKTPLFGVEGPNWNAQIGNTRFYTHIPEEFSFESWKKNFKAGHTFVSSGPIIDFKINGKLPGETINVAKGEEIIISANAFGHSGQIPLKNLKIIGHGQVIDSVSAREPNQSMGELSINTKFKVEQGIWIAAQCEAGPLQFAHTTPIYITVDGGGFHNSKTVHQNLDRCEEFLNEIIEAINTQSPRMNDNIWRFRQQMNSRIKETRQIIAGLREKLK